MINILSSGAKTQEIFLTAMASIFVIFCTMPIHEYAHARAAYLLGDSTAKYNGRMTLDPLKHIDPIGAVLIFLFGFGWAKPVPVNSRNFDNEKAGMAITAFAGPLSNLIMAFFLSFFSELFLNLNLSGRLSDNMSFIFVNFFNVAAGINVALAIFNLFPIPPLDGSKILYAFLPRELYYKFLELDRYAFIFILLIFTIGLPIDKASFAVLDAFYGFWGRIIHLIL